MGQKPSPEYQIDRINNDGNYELSNCRWATWEVQQRNTRKICASNTSGYRGVTYVKSRNKWQSQITINNKIIFLGRFETSLEAATVYDSYIIENNLEHTKNGVI